MNKNTRILIATLAMLALGAAARAATTYEQAYVSSYSSVAGIPKPVAVVTPVVRGSYDATRVDVRFEVDATGTPKNIKVMSDVDGSLAEALTSAVREWKFAPAVVDGKPVTRSVVVPFAITTSS